MMLIKLAWRNIFRHRNKSFVVGVILCIGALIMTLGNAVISGMNQGFERNIVHRFTGHFIVLAKEQAFDNVLINPNAKSVELIPSYNRVLSFLTSRSEVADFLPAAQGYVMALDSEAEDPDFQMMLGVNFEEYQRFFPDSIVADEGKIPLKHQKGVLINSKTRKRFFDYQNIWPTPKGFPFNKNIADADVKKDLDRLFVRDQLVFLGTSEKNTTLDISEPVLGIIRFKGFNQILGIVNLMDIESFRDAMGYVQKDDAKKLTKETQSLMGMDMDHVEAMMGSGDLNQLLQKSGLDHKEKDEILQEDKGVFTQVFIKLKPGVSVEKTIKEWDQIFKTEKLPVRIVTWKSALGEIAQMALLMKVALFIFVMFVFFVAAVMITNTLTMAALERSTEIGMMRAVGASKHFISKLFFVETAVLTIFFGGIGVVFGAILVILLDLAKLSSQNEMLQLLFGAEVFHPILTLSDLFSGALQLFAVILIATVYPILQARRITPLDALKE